MHAAAATSEFLSHSNSDSSFSPMTINSPELFSSPPHHHHVNSSSHHATSHAHVQPFHTFTPHGNTDDSNSTVTGLFPTCPSPVTTASPSSPVSTNGYYQGSNHQPPAYSKHQLPTMSAGNNVQAMQNLKLDNKQQMPGGDSPFEGKGKLNLQQQSSGIGSAVSPAGTLGQQPGNGVVPSHQSSGSNPNFQNDSNSQLYANNGALMNQRVKLNVGGKIFETLLSTLQKAGEESNLATVAKEAAMKDLPMFIDRDSDTFSILLNYLRTGQLLIPSWADFSTVQLLKLDATFYGVHNAQYLHSLDHFNILKKFNYSVNVKFLVPELIVAEIKAATEGVKRKEAESKWLNWYKEDMLSFGRVFKASSISSFNAHFIPPHWCSLKVCFVLWNTNCNKDHIALFMKDLSKLHYIENLEVTEI